MKLTADQLQRLDRLARVLAELSAAQAERRRKAGKQHHEDAHTEARLQPLPKHDENTD